MYETSASADDFYEAIKVFISKPHILNRRICDSVQIHHEKYSQRRHFTPQISAYQTLTADVKSIEKVLHLEDYDPSCTDRVVEIFIHKLLPKHMSGENETVVLSMIEITSMSATFVPLQNLDGLYTAFPYSITYTSGVIRLSALAVSNDDLSLKWLRNNVLPRILKWAENTTNKTPLTCDRSLSLISAERYHYKFMTLKRKYGIKMVKIWPERTDPAKFVYEDVAIAAYLLILWEEERAQSFNHTFQSFVDMGCGNGLLVYILTKEGHPGYGIDVRKRGIWDMYPEDIKLEVETIVPSQDFLFPKTDWLIGNHSDELTPWIPVMAAKSSYNCRFFLLPCCSYEFDGSKYQRLNSSKSLYNDYLEYILSICKVCGVETKIDRLRIPSTKRICLIGQTRMHDYELYEANKIEIQRFIDARCKRTDVREKENLWVENFKPRENVEKVRNCTQLKRTVIEGVIELVSKKLLENPKLGDCSWNAGVPLNLSVIAECVPAKLLKELKAECGGLQTLLRNNHHIFEVCKGKVKFRYPRTVEEVTLLSEQRGKKDLNIKLKPCWFHRHHPDGCPLEDDACSFVH